MSDKIYNKLAFLQRKVIPAVVACIVAVGAIIEAPVCELVGALLSALNVCFGQILSGYSEMFFSNKEITTKTERSETL